MAHALEEVRDMAGAAKALVLNIGTLTPELVEAMILAGQTANERSVPVVLDPVGTAEAGAATETIAETEAGAVEGSKERRPAQGRRAAREPCRPRRAQS